MKKPFLLITNDDGIYAPGIKHLWESVRAHADVAIVAPLTEKSGCGLSITWGKPLKIQQMDWEGQTSAWSVNGTPADCVKMALAVLLDRKPDLIISGINRGSNAGRTVLYSGTLGGVIEGALKNIPGIAFSFSDLEDPPLSSTQPFIYPLIHHFLTHPIPSGTVLNVNFPLNCQNGVKGLQFARQGKGFWIEQPDRRIHPVGLPYYWLGGKWCAFEEEPNSDVALMEQGYITAVPLHVSQLTDEAVFEKHKTAIEKIFCNPLDQSPSLQ